MFKKIFATGLLAALALFAVPTAAQAADYGDGGPGTDNGDSAVVVAGQPVSFSLGGFLPGEPTTASAPDAVTLGALKVVQTASRPAGAAGTVTYTASATQPGSYTITVASATNVGVFTLVVVPADSAAGNGSGSNGALPNTGLETPMLIVWGASGALILGLALVFVLNVVRRNKKTV